MTRIRVARIIVGLAAIVVVVASGRAIIHGQRAIEKQGFIVSCPAACPAVAASVRAMGGDVTQTYVNVDAIAITVPVDRGVDVVNIPGANGVWKDVDVKQPVPVADALARVDADEARVIADTDVAGFIGVQPADYSFNNALINAAGVQAGGNVGAGIITAVIDSGTTNAPVVPALTGTVIGGETFVTGDPVASPTSRRNGAHGTWVGTVIAGHASFLFANTSALVRSLRIHAPSSVIACTPAIGCPTTLSIVPMIGVAPAAKIYAMKVFRSTSDSAPTSIIVAAMDRAITLRRNFNNGMAPVPVSGDGSEDNPFVFNSLKIDVVNMSLGGATFFAGRELDELLTNTMLSVGIVPAISAGNEGFGAMTAGGPGDGFGALGVAAASTVTHERVLRDVQFGVGIGVLYRPSTHTQTAFFSSRGPTADGRFKPDIIANGFATFAQGTCQGSATCLAGTALAPISLVSGTSFSAPTVAGALALARAAAPTASAVELRNALIDTANFGVLGDHSDAIDQGQGFLDVAAAIARLGTGPLSSELDSSNPGRNVRNNIKHIGFRTVGFAHGQFSTHIANLVPGQVAQFYVDAELNDKLTIGFTNITPENPPSGQNSLFGDDLLVTVLDAVTSTNEELFPQTFIGANTVISAIASPGIVRVAIQGDWTNAGRVSADLAITREPVNAGEKTADGSITQGQSIVIPFTVPSGATRLDVELSWKGDWSRYPTSDLDLLLKSPANTTNTAGATAKSPERVSITNPAAGTWQAVINGFSVNGDSGDDAGSTGPRRPREQFALRVTVDGVRLVIP